MGSASMRANKGKGTKPELLARAAMRKERLRFEENVAGLPGKPDLVFRSAGVVVQVHGCFWHGCEACAAAKHLGRMEPGTYWPEKIARNKRRDERDEARLRAAGWVVLVWWEHDVRVPSRLEAMAAMAGAIVDRRRRLRMGKRVIACEKAEYAV